MIERPRIGPIIIFALVSGAGFAAPAGPWSITLRTENDLPANVDRYYTNGFSLSYAQVQLRAGWRTPPDFGSSLIRGIGALPPARDAAP